MCNLLTGSSDKVPLQLMKNENVVLASTHCLLGPSWLQIEEEGGLLSCALQCSAVW